VHKLAGVDLTTVLHREVTLGQPQWANKHLCQVITCVEFLKVPRQLLPDAQPQIHRIFSNEQKTEEGKRILLLKIKSDFQLKVLKNDQQQATLCPVSMYDQGIRNTLSRKI